MRKMIKFLSMAALVLVGAMMTGCSSEDIIDNLQQSENQSNIVTLTTTVSLDGDATTRALTPAGVKTFAEGDQIAVMYSNATSYMDVKAVSNKLTSTDISADGKTATFTVTLDNPNKTLGLAYLYPASLILDNGMPNWDVLYSQQDGTLATLASKCDFCATTYKEWNDDGNLPSLTLTNYVAILAITLKDNTGTPSEITGDITGMTISVTTNKGTSTYTISRSKAAGPIYMAMRPTIGTGTITITATDGTNNYEKEVTDKELLPGHFYPVTIKFGNPDNIAELTDYGTPEVQEW